MNLFEPIKIHNFLHRWC